RGPVLLLVKADDRFRPRPLPARGQPLGPVALVAVTTPGLDIHHPAGRGVLQVRTPDSVTELRPAEQRRRSAGPQVAPPSRTERVAGVGFEENAGATGADHVQGGEDRRHLVVAVECPR